MVKWRFCPSVGRRDGSLGQRWLGKDKTLAVLETVASGINTEPAARQLLAYFPPVRCHNSYFTPSNFVELQLQS
jgi:hypothetical protein